MNLNGGGDVFWMICLEYLLKRVPGANLMFLIGCLISLSMGINTFAYFAGLVSLGRRHLLFTFAHVPMVIIWVVRSPATRLVRCPGLPHVYFSRIGSLVTGTCALLSSLRLETRSWRDWYEARLFTLWQELGQDGMTERPCQVVALPRNRLHLRSITLSRLFTGSWETKRHPRSPEAALFGDATLNYSYVFAKQLPNHNYKKLH